MIVGFGKGQLFQEISQVSVWPKVVGFGCFNQTVDQGADLGSFGSVGEEPVLPADHKGADRVFGCVVIRCHFAMIQINKQAIPLLQGVMHRLSHKTLRHYL